MKIEFIEYKPHEPTPQEIEEEERYWKNIRHYCPKCKKATMFYRCANCGKRFCAEHCLWENDGTWEYPSPSYPMCYHCYG